MNNCSFCNKEINNKGSLGAHIKKCKLNPNRVEPKRSPFAGAQKGSVPWNKGIELDSEHKEKISTSLKDRVIDPEQEKQRRENISKSVKGKTGGFRIGGGKGKKGSYKGFYCDSSWELAFLVYHLDHNIPIERCSEIRYYKYEGHTRKYYPDFIVDSKIYEIKGYVTEQSKAKSDQNPDIITLLKEQVKPYLEYATITYGSDFISLYQQTS